MSLYVFDTDILTLFNRNHPQVCQEVTAHPLDDIVTTVISAEEQMSGWYTFLRKAKQALKIAQAYRELAATVNSLAKWTLLLYTELTIARYTQLLALKLKVGKFDLKIAAIALENGGIVVTRNVRDFQRVPGLQVENWAM
jgi:tRNA(fMet)-specific endonuclease VapC